MKKYLTQTLDDIYNEFSDLISPQGRHYLEVEIGKRAKSLGYDDLEKMHPHTSAIIPIKEPVPGMKVRIDGRGFSGYVQFDSGIAIPGFLAKKTGRPYRQFVPNDSMILNVH